jgi:hypothetical protein
VGSRGHHFSGGEKQRIAIARTLLRDPRMLGWSGAVSALGMLAAVIALAGPAFASGRTLELCRAPPRPFPGGREVRTRAGGGANCWTGPDGPR